MFRISNIRCKKNVGIKIDVTKVSENKKEQFNIDIYSIQPSRDIVNAYYKCDIEDRAFDSVTKKISTCHKLLKVENGTVKIGFIRTDTSKHHFGAITLVIKCNNSYELIDTMVTW